MNKKRIIGFLILISIAIPLVTSLLQEDTSVSVAALKYSSQAWGDYNNDGNLDLVICGTTGTVEEGATANPITKIYQFNGTNFTEDTSQSIVNVSECSVSFGDLNKDGYLDLIISGRINETNTTTRIYEYNGNNFINTQNLTGIRFGSISLGDINNDNNLDILISGCNYFVNKNILQCSSNTTRVYTNNGSYLNYNSSWSSNLSQVWYSGSSFADYDNDGDLDLVLFGTTGANSTTSLYTNAVTKIYKNNGSTFLEDTNNIFEGVYRGSSVWYDFDDDYDVDLFITGRNSSNSRITKVFTSDTALSAPNSKPNAPTTTNATYRNGSIIITWNNGSDTETATNGLYYNLRAGSNQTNGIFFSSKYAVSSNPTQGYFGNMMQMHNKTIVMPQRCVFYAVQTIDAGLRASDFSTLNNYSSDETCDSYDNDCDLDSDEGFDMNNDGTIQATNETFDKDGDGYYPYNGTLINSSDNSNTTFSCSNYESYDCNDSDNSSYPGASCTRDGYTATTLQWNSTTLICDCIGTKRTTSQIISGGGGGTTTKPTITPPTVEPPKTETVTAVPTSDSGGSDKNEYTQTIDTIITNRYKITRFVLATSSQTQITEKIKALDLLGLEEVDLNVDIPKDVQDSAKKIKEVDEFKIIREDPEIEFDLGNFSPLQLKQSQYVINRKLNKDEISRIIANITLKGMSDEERQKKLEEEINETAKYVNLTQEVTVNYDKNQTEFKIKIDYLANETILNDVYIYTEIPKCLIEIIKNELIESDQDFEIVSEDPLIVWHFNSLLDVKEINYNIKAIADEDCANQAKSLAIAKQIVQVKFNPNKSRVFIVISIVPLIILLMRLFGRFSEKVEHKDPKIQKLIHYVQHHYKHGFHEHHIREKLLKEGYHKDDVEEALKLNAKNKLHYIMQRFEVGFEEFILLILIVSSIMEFTQVLPSDANYLQKMIAWTISAFLLYQVSITKLIFGVRNKLIDILLISSFFGMIMKDFVTFANMSFGEAIKGRAYVTDLYAYITQHNNIFEIYCFAAGVIIVTLIALYLSIREEVKAPSFLNIVHFHPKKSKNPFKILLRFLINVGVLFTFFVVIFNLMMEWLALVLDSFILTIILVVMFLVLIKHRKKFTAEKFMYEVTEVNERFYEKFISLFHYKKIVLLGFSGMLILHILTELGNFLVPYITGIKDPIYFGHFYENHIQIFNIIPTETKSLFLTQSAGLPITLKILIFAGYSLNIIAALYLVLLPAYIWYHMFKNRKLPLDHIPKLELGKTNIFLAVTSICFLVLNTVFLILPIKKAGLMGVDIQTRLLDLTNINLHLIIALGAGLIALAISFKSANLIKKLIFTASVLFFGYYVYLFFNNVIMYYIGSIKDLIKANPIITAYLILFLLINIAFYILGVFSFFVELYIRGEIWFEGHSIKLIDKHYKKHHRFHLIHHPNSHIEHHHGTKEEYLENYIKHHIMDGEQLMIIQDHLERQGWPKDIIKSASSKVLEDKNIIDFINNINNIKK